MGRQTLEGGSDALPHKFFVLLAMPEVIAGELLRKDGKGTADAEDEEQEH